jgi:hypothetical protein
MRFAVMQPKVLCCSLGLIGAAGRSSDVTAYQKWMSDGMPPDERPDFSNDKDESLHGLWAKLDGTLWWTDERLVFHQIEAPGTLGEPRACAFVDGAMRAGMEADAAVRLALTHCVYVGGNVTVVRLQGRISASSDYRIMRSKA